MKAKTAEKVEQRVKSGVSLFTDYDIYLLSKAIISGCLKNWVHIL